MTEEAIAHLREALARVKGQHRDPAEGEFITDQELARRLNVDVTTTRRWRIHGTGPPFVKLNATVRYHWPAVLTWVLDRQVQSTSERPAE